MNESHDELLNLQGPPPGFRRALAENSPLDE